MPLDGGKFHSKCWPYLISHDKIFTFDNCILSATSLQLKFTFPRFLWLVAVRRSVITTLFVLIVHTQPRNANESHPPVLPSCEDRGTLNPQNLITISTFATKLYLAIPPRDGNAKSTDTRQSARLRDGGSVCNPGATPSYGKVRGQRQNHRHYGPALGGTFVLFAHKRLLLFYLLAGCRI